MSNNPKNGEPRIQLSDIDRELLESSKNVKLFTFSKSPVEPRLDFGIGGDQRRSLSNRHPTTSDTFTISDSTRTLAEVSRLIEKRNSRPLNSETASKISSQSTVEELMKMLSKKPSSDETISKALSSQQPPPPIPPKPKSHVTRMNKTSDPNERLFFENNNFITADPVITSPTDDEDDDFKLNNNLPDHSKGGEQAIDVHEINSVDSPPRTSTPSINKKLHSVKGAFTSHGNHTTIGINNDTDVIRPTESLHSKSASQIRSLYERVQRGLASHNHSDDDVLDISEINDDLANSSGLNESCGLNESGGCELIGVNENSGDQQRLSAEEEHEDDQLDKPYTVQLFNETTTGSPDFNDIGHERKSKFIPIEAAHQDNRISDLESLTKKLSDEVNSLRSQVSVLTKKIEQMQDVESATTRASVHPISDYSTLSQGLSKSSTTINRSAPFNAREVNTSMQQPGSSDHQRNVPTISQKTNQDSSRSNQQQIPHSYNASTARLARKSYVNESTSSLYADSLRSDCTSSTSPVPNNQYHPNGSQISASRSYMSLSSKPKSYNSMLSLSSAGTLRKDNSGILGQGSVSNLTNPESHLTSWPSTSDFVAVKNLTKDVQFSEEERLIRMIIYENLILMRLPSWIDENYNIDRIIEPPLARLKLEWVHGYRGKDCRCNLFYLPTGECVYFVASIVVLYNPDAKTQRHYLGHTDSVKCLAVHPNKLIVASGQSATQDSRDRRPIVRVWNTVSLATLKVIGFNEDYDRPICCLAFSKHDCGATLAVVDESSEHTITLLDWQRDKNWRIAEANSGHDPVLAIDFHPIDKYSLVAVGRSGLNFWDIRGMTMSKKAGLFDKYSKPKYVLCLTFNDFGDTITGDSNGSIMIWPRNSNRPSKVISAAHHGGVFSIISMKNGTYLTGGRDRRVVEWDEGFYRTGKEAELPEHCGGVRYITYARGTQVLIGTLRNCILLGSLENNFAVIMQGHSDAASSLAVHPQQPIYLTGGCDEQVHLFDTITHQTIWSECLQTPATAASFSPNGETIIIGSTQGKWLVIDAISKEVLFSKCDGTGTITCIKFSPKGDSFVMGSTDSHLYVYQVTDENCRFLSVGACGGHSSPIKEVDWSEDGTYLQSQSMNFELLHWRASNCKRINDLDLVCDIQWSTQNCSLGFNVFGIWSDSLDSALVQSCDRSNDMDLMVSTTSNGYINLFKWPPSFNHCLSQRSYANVSKFNIAKFLPDDSKIVAVDFKHCATTEWTVDKADINP